MKDGGERGPTRLARTLEEVADRVGRARGQGIGEQNTKAALIEPVLRALGWDIEDFEEVRREYRRSGQDKPVDYALLLSRDPALFVEAKGLGENLADRRWANQVVSYASVAGVGWVVLTDGDEYRVYNAHAPVPIEDKLFRHARISEDRSRAAELLQLLSKDQMSESVLPSLWRAETVDRKVRDALETLFSPEPSAWLVRRLAQQIEDLTAGEIRAALSRARISLDFPSPSPRPDAEPIDENAREVRRPTRDVRSPKRIDVTIRDLIGAGLIRPPLRLLKTYLGQELSARIEPDGRVTFEGETYNSPSVAAGYARVSVKGPPARGRWYNTNGWTFWQFEDEGVTKELDVLRQRYLERQALATTGSETIPGE